MIISELESKLKELREEHGDLPVYQAHSSDNESGYFESLRINFEDLVFFDSEEDKDSNIRCVAIDFR